MFIRIKLMQRILYFLFFFPFRYNSTVQSFVVSKLRRGESTELLHANGTAMKNLGKGFGDYEMFNNDEDDLYSRDAAPPPPKQEPLPVELPADEYVIQHRLPFGFYEFIFRLLILNRFRGRTRFISAARLVILYRRKMNIHIAAQRRQQFKSAAQQPSVTSYTKSARSWFYLFLLSFENLLFFFRFPVSFIPLFVCLFVSFLFFLSFFLIYPYHPLL
ncbi:unnamed protein product [Acanthosepion pharaonis]|uniref:Uncharacterized protein n=1 Tax=Acanthosepion pharaonis TaxID=158019 RepID=A0A812C980_ACAPH|nr:unnamed protein product [Sepia pharaonis]